MGCGTPTNEATRPIHTSNDTTPSPEVPQPPPSVQMDIRGREDRLVDAILDAGLEFSRADAYAVAMQVLEMFGLEDALAESTLGQDTGARALLMRLQDAKIVWLSRDETALERSRARWAPINQFILYTWHLGAKFAIPEKTELREMRSTESQCPQEGQTGLL